MKKILITGLQSYIGKDLIKHLNKYPEQYEIETLSVKDDKWKQKSFSDYDVIVHLAALVHDNKLTAYDFEKVNVRMTEDLSLKAKAEGVKHFIFLSTMGVYSQRNNYIDLKTAIDTKTNYAISKLKAERILERHADKQYSVSILRPPMVYGKYAPGNYKSFSKLAQKSPIFPYFQNQRSMIYIENLSAFIRLVIDNEIAGILFPQNYEYVNTYNFLKKISTLHNKKFITVPVLYKILKIMIGNISSFKKVFGNFVYDKSLPGGPDDFKRKGFDYNLVNFEESVRRSEAL